jgi:hypothetical protein
MYCVIVYLTNEKEHQSAQKSVACLSAEMWQRNVADIEPPK